MGEKQEGLNPRRGFSRLPAPLGNFPRSKSLKIHNRSMVGRPSGVLPMTNRFTMSGTGETGCTMYGAVFEIKKEIPGI
jgi:hypothetical protein